MTQSESVSEAIAPPPASPVPMPTTIAPGSPSLPEFAQGEPELNWLEPEAIQPELALGDEDPSADLPLAETPRPETSASPLDSGVPDSLASPSAPSEEPKPEEDTDATERIAPELQQTGDPELGILRLRERPLQKPAQPKFVFLTGSFNYFRSDNILSSEVDTFGDQLLGDG
ncbi:hypothetical protein [Trichothermofontia sp.]